MSRAEHKKIAVFFTHGVSLKVWDARGILSREIKFYQELAQHTGEIWFFTYSREDRAYADQLGSHIRLFHKLLPMPDLLYGILIPFLHARELSKIDVLRVYQIAGAIPALIAHWLHRKPLIVRCGFQWFTFVRQEGASIYKQWCVSWLERMAYRAAMVIIHTTASDADFARRRYGIDEKKIVVIPNYVDVDKFKRLPVDREPRNVCFVGRLEPQKNLDTLIEAMRDIDGRLILYGEGSGRASLEQLAKAYSVQVEFRGRIPNDQLPRALNACALFVLPSRYEGHPKVLLEAMACGIPVIGTNVSGIKEVIEDEKTGLLCQPNHVALHQSIQRLLKDKELQTRLAEAARQNIQTKYSLARIIQQEYDLLASLMHEGPIAHP